MVGSSRGPERRSGADRRSGVDRRLLALPRHPDESGLNRRQGVERRKGKRRGSSYGSTRAMELTLGYGRPKSSVWHSARPT